MKKIKLILSAVVITMAFSAAVASRTTTLVDGYKKINDGKPIAADCTFKRQCDNSGTFRCKVNDGGSVVDLFMLNGTTSCDLAVRHTSPDPIN